MKSDILDDESSDCDITDTYTQTSNWYTINFCLYCKSKYYYMPSEAEFDIDQRFCISVYADE